MKFNANSLLQFYLFETIVCRFMAGLMCLRTVDLAISFINGQCFFHLNQIIGLGLELIDLTMTKRNAGFHITSIIFAFQKISYRKENDVENKNFIWGQRSINLFWNINEGCDTT